MKGISSAFDVFIREPDDIRTAALRMREISEELGPFLILACDDISSPAPMCDAEGNILAVEVFRWVEKSNWYQNKALALGDPISVACRHESETFCFSGGRFISNQPSGLLNSDDLCNIGKLGFNPTSGIIVPIHMSMGTIGAVGWYNFDEDFDVVPVYRRHGDDLLVMASRFINGYRKVTRPNDQLKVNDPHLTKREVLCLKWAAFGKTDEEIALIIGRSTSTIRFHLNNAAMKLNTSNRPQTVVKASQLGFIGQYHMAASPSVAGCAKQQSKKV
ncbi:Helix-turn-helix transcriptional regulator [Georgfuchsia toluolica]|uniref:Helix-turn-helix transcriptional regulator n=1 Tax=Georgfuchsia toluolica TaxID=424218 RepID=A0A916J9E4_9PROT|nr:helix-turn-helix transcriptional regulator [Georgfuchsia toluolica]CAG4884781.1 Helix-turn-helix transcriptional regulator [Georgfuchsia toluolica]